MHIILSEIDTRRFGVGIAKASLNQNDSVSDVIAWCARFTPHMLIARCPTGAGALVVSLEQAGFLLMDTLVYFDATLGESLPVVLPSGYSMRVATEQDAQQVAAIADDEFRDYGGHYHADARLAREDVALVYSSWADSSCRSSAVADAVLVVERGGAVAAFLTVKLRADAVCEIVLNAVAREHQRRGLYAALVVMAKNWALEHGCRRMLVSTQVHNVAPQKVWCRHGFVPAESLYTFHKWFD